MLASVESIQYTDGDDDDTRSQVIKCFRLG